jgi:pyruvate dehydrogenase E2 component (dihydrolipoamide acetyltransferase)
MSSFKLPDLGEGMEEAEIMAWLVTEGAVVELDEPFIEVQTDKAVVQIPSPVRGRVARLHGAVGDVVKVGSVLAEFETDGEAPLVSPAPAPAAAPIPEAAPPPAPAAASNGAAAGPRRRVKAAPAVRRLAAELGVDLERVTGTGDGGRVAIADVRRVAEQRPDTVAAPGAESAAPVAAQHPAAQHPAESAGVRPGERIPLRGVQRRMAQVMTSAWEIPHITGMDELDASALLSARAAINKAYGATVPVTLLAFFLKATAQTLRGYPIVNARLDVDAGEIITGEDINIGFAVAAPSGLVVPVVRRADTMSIRALAEEIARLTAAARGGTQDPRDLRDGTFTVTNYGALGRGRFATPIIRPPEVAILGFGAVVKRPWVVDDEIVVRPVLPWSFSADHRIIDGHTSGSFQRDVTALLANPDLMLFDA